MTSSHFRKVAVYILTIVMITTVVSILFSAALIPSSNASSLGAPTAALALKPSIVPPVNTGILKDPTGTYTFSYLGNGQYSMNLTASEKLLHDPYSGIPNASGEARVLGNSVIITPPRTNTTSYPTDVNGAWSGAGGGDCSSFSVSNGNAICNGSSGSLGTSGVLSNSVTWNPTCFSGSSCITSFWAGLSPNSTGSTPLMQNGINVCENNVGCPGGGSKGGMTWDMWWVILGQQSSDQVIPAYPTTINGTNYEFVFAFVNSNTQPTFQWTVGSWTYSYTTNSNYAQSSFWQSEAIMEPPVVNGVRQVMTAWSPNPNGMTGWWETGNWCGCTYTSGYYGSSYVVVLYTVTSPSGSTEAYGSITGSTTFSDTFA